ncbi:MAG: DEAD/DEAH box helicase [Eubacteriales bacterium]|nr:DEAD/DEAH box helicase [Eubacteriales bacterium]
MSLWDGKDQALFNRKLLEAAQGPLPESSGLVLMPILSKKDGAFLLKLKTGQKRLYTVRNIPGFLLAVQSGQSVTLGKQFTYSPAWMRYPSDAQALITLLSAFVLGPDEGGRPPAVNAIPLSDAFLRLVLEKLADLEFQVETEKGTQQQTGIREGSLPLLFSLGYDIRGAVLTGAWQGDCRPLTEDGSFALVDGRVLAQPREDRALAEALMKRSEEPRFTYRFSREETQRVFSELLPALQRRYALTVEEEMSRRLLKFPLKAEVYLDRAGDEVQARVLFKYGDYAVDPFERSSEIPLYLFRDAQGERDVMDLLAQNGFRVRKGQVYLADDGLIFDFLMTGVRALHRAARVYLSQAFRQLTPRAPSFSGHLGIKAGKLKLSLMDEERPVEELLPLMQALSQRKPYFRYRDGTFITLSDADSWREMAQAWQERNAQAPDTRDLESMHAHYMAALAEKDGLPVSVDSGVRMAVEMNPEDLMSPVKGLYDYQLRGFRWICSLHMLGMGGILADEMGLGKTAQMIAAILHFKKADPARMQSLIVAPTTLMHNWLSEIRRFAPGLTAQVMSGGKASRERQLRAIAQGEEEAPDVLITSYPLLRQDIARIVGIRFRFAVLDEAQHIKNVASLTAKAAKRINAMTRLALTGTPMENNVSELWSLFDFCLPGYLPPLRLFLQRYEEGRNAQDLRLRIRPFLMRRLKKDVMAELPEKMETTLYARMYQEQRRVYDAALLQSRARVHELLDEKGLSGSRIEVLAAITLLRQICCHPKLALPDYHGSSAKVDLLMDVLPETLANGHRALIFSQFTSFLKIVREHLGESGIPSLYLDGETPAAQRLELVEQFNMGAAPVFLVSLKAGGTGLNLTGADTVIHLDPWWNPTAEEQANDRAHRLGQEKTVQIVHLISPDSIEEAVVEMGVRKRRLFDRLITPGETLPQRLTREEVLKLFDARVSPDAV